MRFSILLQESLPPPPVDVPVTRLAFTPDVAAMNVSVSVPEPPSMMSSPRPALMMSFPPPAVMMSLPEPVVIVFAPPSVVTVLFPLPSVTFSNPEIVSLPSPVAAPVTKFTVTSLDVVNTSVSVPSPPINVSSPSPP